MRNLWLLHDLHSSKPLDLRLDYIRYLRIKNCLDYIRKRFWSVWDMIIVTIQWSAGNCLTQVRIQPYSDLWIHIIHTVNTLFLTLNWWSISTQNMLNWSLKDTEFYQIWFHLQDNIDKSRITWSNITLPVIKS